MPYTPSPINTCQLTQFQAWTDQYGMITNNSSGNSTDNGNLYTAHYVYGLISTTQITDQEKQRILQVYANNFSYPGILCRTPNFPGNRQAQDDIFGLMGAEALLSPDSRSMTRSVYEYGLKSASGIDSTELDQWHQKFMYWLIRIVTLGRCRWVWNNIEPGTFDETSWLGRFPTLIVTMQMSLKEWVNPFFWSYWAVSCMYNAWFGSYSDNNGDCQSIHAANAAQGYGPLTNFVCSQIHKGIKRKYGSAGVLMEDYFQNAQHPLCLLLNNVD
jgi:hypothetical protein